MQKTHNILYRTMQPAALLASLMFVLLLAACDNGDVPGGGQSDGGYSAGFYITTGNQTVSRAPSPGEYEPGSAIENLIDIERGDFKVLLFDRNDLYLGSLNHTMIKLVSTDGSNKTYRVDGTLPPEIIDGADQLKLMVLANWRGNYPELTQGQSRITDVADASQRAFRFSANSADNSGDDHIALGPDVAGSRLIPMYGVTNLLTGLSYYGGWCTELGTLHMLRAFAKIRVRAGEESFDLESVKLIGANTALYQGPRSVKQQDDYMGNAYHLDYYKTPSVPAGTTRQQSVDFYRDEANGDWILYVPEFVNIEGGNAQKPLAEAVRSRIEVRFKNSPGSFYVDFKYYNTPPAYAVGAKTGDHFDILRNNVYDYTLNRLEGEADLKVEVDVIPYGEVVLQPEYGLTRDEETGWIIIDKFDQRYYYADKDYQYYNKDKEPIATRVEFNDDKSLFYIYWPKNSELMYVFDRVNQKYYTDKECSTELTSPMQLRRFFVEFTDVDPVKKEVHTYFILRTDQYGKVMYLWDVDDNACKDENLLLHSPVINHGYQLYDGEDLGIANLLVIKMDCKGVDRFFYDWVNDKYYRNDMGEDQKINLVECEAFPPKN